MGLQQQDEPRVPGSHKINMKLTYPYSDEYEYMTQLVRFNLDDRRVKDVLNDNGFIISPTNGIKKDIKDPNSIFSPKYGQSLKDVTQFGGNKYKCDCGYLTGAVNNNVICPVCGHTCKEVGDNFEYTGWLVLKEHYYIHMAYYQSIRFFIGKDLDNILDPKRTVDEDGIVHDVENKPKGQPYYGLGMIGFKEKFDEIMDFYLKKSKTKAEYYYDIMEHKNDVFAQSIPVFTSHLRPYSANQHTFSHEDTNATYTMINKYVTQLNIQTKYEMQRQQTTQEDKILFNLQMKIQELYDKVIAILEGKRGTIRSLFGGRCNFSSRSVIVAAPNLRIDQVTLPYKSLMVLLQQSIINILHKTYGMQYNDAYSFWHQSYLTKTPTCVNIINSLIRDIDSQHRGIPIIINRNPTINYGGILMMWCVGMTDTYTMGVPLPILPSLAADFDKLPAVS